MSVEDQVAQWIAEIPPMHITAAQRKALDAAVEALNTVADGMNNGQVMKVIASVLVSFMKPDIVDHQSFICLFAGLLQQALTRPSAQSIAGERTH